LKFKHDLDFKWLDVVEELFKKAQQMKLDMIEEEATALIRQIAEEISFKILEQPNSSKMSALTQFHSRMLKLKIDYYTYIVQNNIAVFIHNRELTPELEELARIYGLDYKNFQKMRISK